MQDAQGNDCRVYRLEIRPQDYSGIWGRQVSGTIDRRFGSAHPLHPEMISPINYGYVDGGVGRDGRAPEISPRRDRQKPV